MRGLLALAGSVGRKVRSRKFELMSSIRLSTREPDNFLFQCTQYSQRMAFGKNDTEDKNSLDRDCSEKGDKNQCVFLNFKMVHSFHG